MLTFELKQQKAPFSSPVKHLVDFVFTSYSWGRWKVLLRIKLYSSTSSLFFSMISLKCILDVSWNSSRWIVLKKEETTTCWKTALISAYSSSVDLYIYIFYFYPIEDSRLNRRSLYIYSKRRRSIRFFSINSENHLAGVFRNAFISYSLKYSLSFWRLSWVILKVVIFFLDFSKLDLVFSLFSFLVFF